MRKLLSAGFARLFKNKLFYMIAALSAAAAVFMRLFAYYNAQKVQVSLTLDAGFFANTAFLGIIMAAFCGMFVGTEYSDGTLRNKLAVGHSRNAVYLSNVILCSVAGIFFQLAFWIGSLAVGLPLSGWFVGSAASIFVPAVLCIALVLAYSAIFVLIVMLNQSKAASSVICLILAFVLLFGAAFVISALEEPEYYEAYSITTDAGTVSEAAQPNPNFLRGTKRDIYEFLFDFLPGCQGLRMSQVYEPSVQEPILGAYSLLIALLTTGAGLLLFKKKNIK